MSISNSSRVQDDRTEQQLTSELSKLSVNFLPEICDKLCSSFDQLLEESQQNIANEPKSRELLDKMMKIANAYFSHNPLPDAIMRHALGFFVDVSSKARAMHQTPRSDEPFAHVKIDPALFTMMRVNSQCRKIVTEMIEAFSFLDPQKMQRPRVAEDITAMSRYSYIFFKQMSQKITLLDSGKLFIGKLGPGDNHLYQLMWAENVAACYPHVRELIFPCRKLDAEVGKRLSQLPLTSIDVLKCDKSDLEGLAFLPTVKEITAGSLFNKECAWAAFPKEIIPQLLSLPAPRTGWVVNDPKNVTIEILRGILKHKKDITAFHAVEFPANIDHREEVFQIVGQLKTLRHLSLAFEKPMTGNVVPQTFPLFSKEMLQSIAPLTELESLCILSTPRSECSDELLHMLITQFPKLEQLQIDHTLISLTALRSLQRLPNLRTLSFSHDCLSDDLFLAIGNCVRLEKLASAFISYKKENLTQNGLNALSKLSSLQFVKFGQSYTGALPYDPYVSGIIDCVFDNALRETLKKVLPEKCKVSFFTDRSIKEDDKPQSKKHTPIDERVQPKLSPEEEVQGVMKDLVEQVVKKSRPKLPLEEIVATITSLLDQVVERRIKVSEMQAKERLKVGQKLQVAINHMREVINYKEQTSSLIRLPSALLGHVQSFLYAGPEQVALHLNSLESIKDIMKAARAHPLFASCARAAKASAYAIMAVNARRLPSPLIPQEKITVHVWKNMQKALKQLNFRDMTFESEPQVLQWAKNVGTLYRDVRHGCALNLPKISFTSEIGTELGQSNVTSVNLLVATSKDCKGIKGMPKLQEISCGPGISMMLDSLFRTGPAQENPSITEKLDYSDRRRGDELGINLLDVLNDICAFRPNISSLSLPYYRSTRRSIGAPLVFETIGKLSKLEHLVLPSCTKEALQHFSALNRLKSFLVATHLIYPDYKPLDSEACERFVTQFPLLESAYLQCFAVDEASLALFQKAAHLQKLHVGLSCALSDAVCTALQGCKNLNYLHFNLEKDKEIAITAEGIQALSSLQSLKYLSLRRESAVSFDPENNLRNDDCPLVVVQIQKALPECHVRYNWKTVNISE